MEYLKVPKSKSIKIFIWDDYKMEKRTVELDGLLTLINSGRFNGDLKLWIKWYGSEKIPPVTFSNGDVEKKELLSKESDKLWHSVMWRVQGTFRGNFPLHRFPFDTQKLRIEVELPDESGIPDLPCIRPVTNEIDENHSSFVWF